MSDTKPTKKISAKAIMIDLRDGLADGELMQKYGLSFQGLQDLFSKLIEAKLATPAYFEKRAVSQAGKRGKEEKARPCPYCGFQAHGQFTKCPRCGQDVTEWLDTVELTKILTGTFE
jgi:hypothetical protein